MLERFGGLDAAARGVVAAGLGASDTLRAEAEGLMADPALAWIFAPGTLAEVGFAAPWGDVILSGSIDRLVVGDGVVTVVDFKSNAVVPATAGRGAGGVFAADGGLCAMRWGWSIRGGGWRWRSCGRRWGG